MIGGGLLLIILIVVAIVSGRNREELPEPTYVPPDASIIQDAPAAEPVADTGRTIPTTPAPTPQTEEEKQALYVRQFSRDFTERFLTFTNKNNNIHLADTKELMTPSMWQWAQTQALPFDAVTMTQETRVISTRVQTISAENAVVEIGIQQSKQQGDASEVIYKNGSVELVRIGGEWKVNGLFLQ